MKRNRILSAVLCAVLLLSLCVTGAAAKELPGIKNVELAVTAPEVGVTPAKDVRVVSPSDVVITKYWWEGTLDKNGKPQAGASASLSVILGIAPGSDAIFNKYSIQVTVNGQKASPIVREETTVRAIANWYFKAPDINYTPPTTSTQNYDTFDYRAYANVYPDLKAAYGYNAEKLYAHYVNYGKAEGRVGTFISGSNPKTNAPIYGIVEGTNKMKDNNDTDYAVVPATLLDAIPPEHGYQVDNWRLNQLTHIRWMSNAKLVAEYYSTKEYMGDEWGGSYGTEPVEIRALRTIPEELRARTVAVQDVYDWEHGIQRDGLTENAYLNSKDSDAYKRAMCTDTAILFHCDDYRWGRSTFAAPPANPGTPGNPPAKTVGGFSDVTEKDYFAQPVLWAVENGVTGGTGNGRFSPAQTCTQAQILTFLWRSQGSPEPEGTAALPGMDTGAYYYKAALWAKEQGLIGEEFAADAPCTRAMAVTYLWKQAGSPAAPAAGFTDVPPEADYAQAVAWAVEKGVTGGTSATTFAPEQTCTRGQIVTFLYRAFAG